ncbi:MAG: OmpA family protein, partial [Bdellovibrionales bacterium]|nr:OmpA family protein [Bdellovibrionales bacterium]
MKIWQISISALSAFIFFVSCASKEKLATIDPKSEHSISQMESELAERKTAGQHLASPENFEEATEIVEESREMANHGQPYEKVEEELDKARSLLDDIDKNMETAEFHLAKVIDAREQALAEGAAGTDLFDEADDSFEDLGEKIEKGNLNKVIADKENVIKEYSKAEVAAIQNRELAIARNNLQAAKDLDASDEFSDLIETTSDRIKAANKIIEQNKDDKYSYEKAVTEATDTSKLLLARVKTATWIENSSPRDVTLHLENDLAAISKNMNKESLVYYPYVDKVYFIKQNASELPEIQAKLEETRKTASEKERKLTRLEIDNMGLNTKVRQELKLKNNLEFVQSMFSPDEAEVLRKGDDLIIRLIGVNFPVDKSKVTDNSKPVLQKVARVIKKFDTNSIEVQGHTDETGPAIYNERLSEKRAENVSQYLIDKTGKSSLEFSNVGYG